MPGPGVDVGAARGRRRRPRPRSRPPSWRSSTQACRCAGVLGRVGQALGDREVDRRLDRRRRPPGQRAVDRRPGPPCRARAPGRRRRGRGRRAPAGGCRAPRSAGRRSRRAVAARASLTGTARRAPGRSSNSSSAMPRLIDTATSRAWAPSCRSRSSRRSSAAEWSTAAARLWVSACDPALQRLGAAVAEQRAVDHGPGPAAAGRSRTTRRSPVTTPSSSTTTSSDITQPKPIAQTIHSRSRQVIGSVSTARRRTSGPRSGSGRYGGGSVDARAPTPAMWRCRLAITRISGTAAATSRMPTQTTTSSAADDEQHQAAAPAGPSRAPARRRTRSAGTCSAGRAAGRGRSAAARPRQVGHGSILADARPSRTVVLAPPRVGSCDP